MYPASSRGAGRVTAESAPACSARASPTARRSAGGDCISSRESSSAKRSAKSSTESSSAIASGRPAALSSEVTMWSSLSAAMAAPLGPPDRSTSSATSWAYPAASSAISQTCSRRPASSTTADVSVVPAEAVRSAGSAEARPQYTRTSATASSSSRDTGLALPETDAPRSGSVAPVHNRRDLADNGAPTQTCGLCPDFLQPAPTQETTDSAVDGSPQRLVQIVQARAGGEHVQHGR